MIESQKNLAVLIDADNFSPKHVGPLLKEIARYGTATVRRAYGDWTTNQLSGWKNELSSHAIQPIQQFANTKGKNSTDSALIIDAMDLLYTGRFEGFCLVSSDSDFTRLAARIRENGLTVYGFGERKTPASLVAACDKFVHTELLTGTSSPTGTSAKGSSPAKGNRELIKLLRTAIADASGDDGWAHLGGVGSNIQKNRPDFDTREYGHSNLSSLIQAVGVFEVRREQHHIRIRDPKAGD